MPQNILKGDQLQLFFSGATFAYATNHVLTLSTSTTDTSSKDHGSWGASAASKVTWELQADNLYTDADYDTLWNLMIKREAFEVKFGLVGNYSPNGLIATGGDVASWLIGSKYFKGNAVITNLQLNAATGENANYSVTLTGYGPLVSFDSDYTDPSQVVALYFNNTNAAKTVVLENADAEENELYLRKVWGGYPGEEIEGNTFELPAHSGFSVLYYFPDGHIPAGIWDGDESEVLLIMNSNDPAVIIDPHAFQGNTSLAAIDLRGAEIIGDYAFADCDYLGTEVTISEGGSSTVVVTGGVYDGENTVRSIGESAFDGCTALEWAEWGDSVMSINKNAYLNSDLESIKLHGVVPPTLYYDADNGDVPFPDSLAAIQVPSRAERAYRNAAGWSNYQRIMVPFSETIHAAHPRGIYDPSFFTYAPEPSEEPQEPQEPQEP